MVAQQQYSFGAPPNLYTALHGQPSSTIGYAGSGDWFLDTGASTHMTGANGIPHTHPVPPSFDTMKELEKRSTTLIDEYIWYLYNIGYY
jgi:hypothetical protein